MSAIGVSVRGVTGRQGALRSRKGALNELTDRQKISNAAYLKINTNGCENNLQHTMNVLVHLKTLLPKDANS